jgi:hypothetical protein
MTWITENWIVVLLGVGFIAFHLLGHRGHINPAQQRAAGVCPGRSDRRICPPARN